MQAVRKGMTRMRGRGVWTVMVRGGGLLLLLVALLQTGARAQEEIATELVSVEYAIQGAEATVEEMRAAEKLACVKAVSAALDGEENMPLKASFEKFNLMEQVVGDRIKCIPSLSVAARRVKDGQLQMKVAVKVNLREISALVRGFGKPATEKAKQEGMFVLYIAREAQGVMAYDPKKTQRSEQTSSQTSTDEGVKIAESKVSGGSTERKMDQVKYVARGTDTLGADVGSVFSNRGFELYKESDLDLNQELLKKIPEYWAEEDRLPQNEIGLLREQLKGGEGIRYFVLVWLDVGQVDQDKDLGKEVCAVTVSGEVVDLSKPGKRGKSIFNIATVNARGFGSNQALAKEEATKLAAKEAATRVVSGIVEKLSGN